MLKPVFPAALAVMLCLAISATAQTAETETPQAEAQAETPEADTPDASDLESQLSIGEDASEAPGQTYTKETNGAWELRCVRAETEEEELCQMYQLMQDAEGVPVAEISLFRLPGSGKAKAGATVIVPLETALPNQLTITVDSGQAKRYPYAFCNPVGCYARIGLTEADVAAYKRGNKATLTLVPAAAVDQKVTLEMSLDGFTASFDKASVLTR